MQKWAFEGAHWGPIVGLMVGLGPEIWAISPQWVGPWARDSGPFLGSEEVYLCGIAEKRCWQGHTETLRGRWKMGF